MHLALQFLHKEMALNLTQFSIILAFGPDNNRDIMFLKQAVFLFITEIGFVSYTMVTIKEDFNAIYSNVTTL